MRILEATTQQRPERVQVRVQPARQAGEGAAARRHRKQRSFPYARVLRRECISRECISACLPSSGVCVCWGDDPSLVSGLPRVEAEGDDHNAVRAGAGAGGKEQALEVNNKRLEAGHVPRVARHTARVAQRPGVRGGREQHAR